MKTFVLLFLAVSLYSCCAEKRQADPNAPSAPAANGTKCEDTVDYCWTEPDSNCFGIYEPWARGHCPFRCGFCDEKPPCEDKLDYCSQYDSSACADPNYINFLRQNCRKTCNLCALPTPPAGVTIGGGSNGGSQVTSGSGTGTGSGSNSAPTSGSVVTPSSDPNGPQTNPGNPINPNVTIPAGSILSGAKNTFIIQGTTALVDDTCYYKGESFQQDKNWYDGCDYVCNCLDAKRNRIICTERCTMWQNTNVPLDGCTWVQESGDCCRRLECSED